MIMDNLVEEILGERLLTRKGTRVGSTIMMTRKKNPGDSLNDRRGHIDIALVGQRVNMMTQDQEQLIDVVTNLIGQLGLK